MSSPHLSSSLSHLSHHSVLPSSSSSSSSAVFDSHMHDGEGVESDVQEKEESTLRSLPSSSSSSSSTSHIDQSASEVLDLPASCITKIVKSCIPANFQLQRDVRSQFAKAGAIFVLYLMHSANEFTEAAGRSSITSTDVLSALEEMDLEALLPTLNEFLRHYQKENSGRGRAPRVDATKPKGKPGRKKKVPGAPPATKARNGDRKAKGERRIEEDIASATAASMSSAADEAMAVEPMEDQSSVQDISGQYQQEDTSMALFGNPAINEAND